MAEEKASQGRMKGNGSPTAKALSGKEPKQWYAGDYNGGLYRYYLPTRENQEHAGASGLPRLLASETRSVRESRNFFQLSLVRPTNACGR